MYDCGEDTQATIAGEEACGDYLQDHIWVRFERCNGEDEYSYTSSMPSTHSATISYFAVFIVLAATQLPVHPSISWVPPTLIHTFTPVFMVTTALVICISRIRLGHHTLKQVGAGISVGAIWGLAWFWWWSKGGAQDIAWNIVNYLPTSIRGYIR